MDVYSVTTGKLERRIVRDFRNASISARGDRVALVRADGTLKVWDVD